MGCHAAGVRANCVILVGSEVAAAIGTLPSLAGDVRSWAGGTAEVMTQAQILSEMCPPCFRSPRYHYDDGALVLHPDHQEAILAESLLQLGQMARTSRADWCVVAFDAANVRHAFEYLGTDLISGSLVLGAVAPSDADYLGRLGATAEPLPAGVPVAATISAARRAMGRHLDRLFDTPAHPGL
jgi:hypothetical protein